jgi:SSS family solute:Na+ symporter
MSRIFSGVVLVLAFACGALIDAKQLEKWVLFINSSLVVFSLPLAWLKWFWWRLNVVGDMVGILGGFPAGYVVWFGSDAVLPQALRTRLHLNGLIPAFSNLERFPFWMGFAVLFVLGWVVILFATLITRPESPEVLRKFYLSAKPIGWWGPIRRALSEEESSAVKRATQRDIWACGWGIAFYFVLTVALFGFMGGRLGIATLASALAIVSGWMFVRKALWS